MSDQSRIVKVSLSVGGASLNIEGDKETVTAQIALFYEIFGSGAGAGSAQTASDDEVPATAARQPPARPRRSASGPSCASRIDTLREEGFFSQKRSAKDVADRLDEKATPYGANHIAAAIQQLTKKGVLRRIKGESGWQYINP